MCIYIYIDIYICTNTCLRQRLRKGYVFIIIVSYLQYAECYRGVRGLLLRCTCSPNPRTRLGIMDGRNAGTKGRKPTQEPMQS